MGILYKVSRESDFILSIYHILLVLNQISSQKIALHGLMKCILSPLVLVLEINEASSFVQCLNFLSERMQC